MGVDALPLDPRRVTAAFLPLAASWLMMAAEIPICTAMIGRLANPEVNTAALLAVMTLSLLIESPIIDLLATATTWADGLPAYRVLRQFTFSLIGLTFLCHGIVAFTPVYGWVARTALGLPQPVAEAARVPLMILLLWSPMIGWRRMHQGVLIRHGRSREVGLGTSVRLVTLVVVGVALFLTRAMPGVQVAATALVISVTLEAAYVYSKSRVVARGLGMSETLPPKLRDLTVFHVPLTLATLLAIGQLPVMTFALARMPDSVNSMAAWMALIGITFVMETVTLALPEVVISLQRFPNSVPVLSRFCLTVGAVLSGIMLLLSATGAHRFLFRDVLGAAPTVAVSAANGFTALAAVPFLMSVASLFKGLHTARKNTLARLLAVAAAMSTLVAGLFIARALGANGITAAAAAVTSAAVAETSALGIAWWIGQKNRENVSIRTVIGIE